MWKLGVVSFLNARPLVEGLAGDPRIACCYAVPAELPGLLEAGAVDAALVPVVDVLRGAGRLRIVSDACIGSDGETLTVRVFSRLAPERVHHLAADVDSHTSVCLARVIWRRLYGHDLAIEPLDIRQTNLARRESLLLIGDKVVQPLAGHFPHQLDLGEAWKRLTGLPFVFAVWAVPVNTARDAEELAELARLLETARDRGVRQAARIALEEGPARGWNPAEATHYLTNCLRYTLDQRARTGVERFAREGAALGLWPEVPALTWPEPSRRQRVQPVETKPAGPVITWKRLSDAEALELYTEASIHELGRLAFERCHRLHPEPYRTYVVDRNINYSNLCTARCLFCNFYRPPGHPEGYVLDFAEIARKVDELRAIGGTQVLLQGGLVPAADRHGPGVPFAYYLNLLNRLKRDFPEVHLHAFSPPEIWWFHQAYRMPVREVLLRLQEAGLDTIPGGGGEILVDRVRRKISRGKTNTEQWLEVMRTAHRLGMRTSCTMMFGHIETLAERIEHLRRLRELQDETGGFIAFIHWPFQPGSTPLGRWKRPPAEGVEADRPEETLPVGDANRHRRLPDGKHLCLADAHEYLRLLAVARLYLDNIPNIQSSWVTMGPKIGQLALFFGANDMGSVMMEENVVSAAGTTFRLNEAAIRRLIADAGWRPQKRNQYYRPIPDGDESPSATTSLPVVEVHQP